MAVVPPPDVLDALEGWLYGVRAALARTGGDGLRWTTREQWHVTLRFLGDTPLRAAAGALDALDAVPVDAELGPGIRALGGGVLCLAVRGLDGLAGAVAAATGHIGRPPEQRPFRGHLTLARVRSGRRAPRPGRLVEGVSGAASPPPFTARFEVREVQLLRSTLRPSAAVYDIVSRRLLPG